MAERCSRSFLTCLAGSRLGFGQLEEHPGRAVPVIAAHPGTTRGQFCEQCLRTRGRFCLVLGFSVIRWVLLVFFFF